MFANAHLESEVGHRTVGRLRSLCASKKLNLQVVAQKFVLERVVTRLFQSDHSDIFALKGGILMMQVEDVGPLLARNTEDIDLQAPGFTGSIADFEGIVRDILSKPAMVDDGIRFDLSLDRIRRNARSDEGIPGGSLHIPAQIGRVAISFKIDVTFDSRPIFSVAVDDVLPSVLGGEFGSVPVRRIPYSWTLADKIQAQVRHGDRTTRLKDFYDIFLIMDRGLADPDQTIEALRMTFDLFDCPIPASVDDIPALSNAYAFRNAQAWEKEKASRRFAVETPALPAICRMVREEIAPLLEAARALSPYERRSFVAHRAPVSHEPTSRHSP